MADKDPGVAAGQPAAAPRKLYELTPEHRAQLKPWADKWVKNALSCKPMDDEDRAAMRAAIDGMYEAANLKPPAHVAFVPSPLVLAVAGPIAAGIHYLRKHPEFLKQLLEAGGDPAVA